MTSPAVPRPAASIILLRRGSRHDERGIQALMVRRSEQSSFMPGVWVFPGGVIERGETPEACAVRELREEAGVELAVDAELVAWSRWITPEFVPVRFDTDFYVALAPAHASPAPDGAETTAARWFEPQEALDLHRAGELSLVFPTIKHLESLLPYRSSEEALEAARGRLVKPVLPRVVGEGSDRRVVLPGEPGYEL